MVMRNATKPGSSARPVPGGVKRVGVYTGAAGREQAEKERLAAQQRAEQRKAAGYKPFRYRLSPGESGEAIVLDEEMSFFRYEHNLKGPDGKYTIFCGCLSEVGICPACDVSGKEAYFVGFLTVIDLRGYTNSKGEKVSWSRKLVPVKIAQQKKFNRLMEKNGSLRGMVLTFTRDGDKDSVIGNDIEFSGEYVSEEDLASYVRVVKTAEGKQEKEDCSVPYDYFKVFPEEEDTEEFIEKLLGTGPAPGSRRYEEAELNKPAPRRVAARVAKDDDDWEDQADSDDPPFDVEEKPAPRTARTAAPARRGAPSRAPVEEAEDEEAEIDDAEDVGEKPRTVRAVRRAAPAAEDVEPAPVRRPIRRA